MPQPSQILDELALYLRPPGLGIHAVSTGRAEAERFAVDYLTGAWEPGTPWRRRLEEFHDLVLRGGSPVAILGVPSDTGAGILRGAARGPDAIRRALGRAEAFDLGDVFCVPQLLDDEMHSSAQLARSRDAVYRSVPAARRRNLPVSPVSMTSRAVRLVRALVPEARILLLGGDHTVTWPFLEALLDRDPRKNRDVGIVHFDAHTDLLEERLGVRYCFATWAYHANDLIGRGGRLVQIGIRASGRGRRHWESTLGVRQIWGKDARALKPGSLADSVVAHLKRKGVRRVYVSNDIDGTDSRWAAACGTPEPGGLTPGHVLAVIEGVARAGFDVIGADVVELAPTLSLSEKKSRVSVATAVRYARAELELLAGGLGSKAGRRSAALDAAAPSAD